jgi:hypothetical protein
MNKRTVKTLYPEIFALEFQEKLICDGNVSGICPEIMQG